MNQRLSKSPTSSSAANQPAQRKANTTGLSDNLKSGIEGLSGYSMDDVRVHYNSSKPAQLHAHAYARGNQIHLASGQEKHLPHEAWHVVQQKQGRVKPTIQLKGSVPINDDVGLEKEADMMGEKAKANSHIQLKSKISQTSNMNGLELRDIASQVALPTQLSEEESAEKAYHANHNFLANGTKIGKDQMSKAQFLDALHLRLTHLADTELGKIGQTTKNCPYLSYWIAYYKRLPAISVERAIRLYAPEVAQAKNAHVVLDMTCRKVIANLRKQLAKSPLYSVSESNPDTLMAPKGVETELIPPKVSTTKTDTAQLGKCCEEDDSVKKQDASGQSTTQNSGGGTTSTVAATSSTLPAASGAGSDHAFTPAEVREISPRGSHDHAIPSHLWMRSDALSTLKEHMNGQYELWGKLSGELSEFCRTHPDEVKKSGDILDFGKLTIPRDFKIDDASFQKGKAEIPTELRRKVGNFLFHFMRANGQLAYISSKDWFRSGAFNVVVEINFYPSRRFSEGSDKIGVHKDTDSRNLFVNLIFNNSHKMPGTEWTLDHLPPDPVRRAELSAALPPEELEAMLAAKRKMKARDLGMDRWEGGTAPVHNFVSWTDELIWHSTPAVKARPKYSASHVLDWLETGSSLSFLFEAMQLLKESGLSETLNAHPDWLKSPAAFNGVISYLRRTENVDHQALYRKLYQDINRTNWSKTKYKKDQLLRRFQYGEPGYLYEAMLTLRERGNPLLDRYKDLLKDKKTWDESFHEILKFKDINSRLFYNELLGDVRAFDWSGEKISGRTGLAQTLADNNVSRTTASVPGRPRANSDAAIQAQNLAAIADMKKASPSRQLPARSFIRTWVTLVKNPSHTPFSDARGDAAK